MNKLLIFFMAGYLLVGTMVSWSEGGGGSTVTYLTAAIDDNDTTINVASTEGFFKYDYVVIGDEYIKYKDKTSTSFTGCERGYSGTTADAHSINSKVLSSQAEVLSGALGFNIAATGSTAGEISLPTFATKFFTVTLGRLVTWDFAIFKGNVFMEYVRVFLQILSIGFIFSILIAVISALGSILAGIFNR